MQERHREVQIDGALGEGGLRRGLAVLASFVIVGGAVALCFPKLISWDIARFDPFLTFCWSSMLGLACVGVRPRRDVVLALVALVGGALIESWGTRSGLWTYFDGQRPPPFILPAWPAAAVATERVARPLARWADRAPPRAASAVYAIVLVGYLVLLSAWIHGGHGEGHPLTWVASSCLLVTVVAGGDRRQDLALFVAGALVGYLLERWGTTRGCWRYWSGETPPWITVLSHGAATLAFARGASFVERAWPPTSADDRAGAGAA